MIGSIVVDHKELVSVVAVPIASFKPVGLEILQHEFEIPVFLVEYPIGDILVHVAVFRVVEQFHGDHRDGGLIGSGEAEE